MLPVRPSVRHSCLISPSPNQNQDPKTHNTKLRNHHIGDQPTDSEKNRPQVQDSDHLSPIQAIINLS